MNKKAEYTAFWAGPDRLPVDGGDLRLLSAREVLEARREGDALAQDGRELALCRNACLIARALEQKGRPVYQNGGAVLDALRVEDIARLSGQWAQFNKNWNPSPLDGEQELERRKKAWSTRVMSAFNGACSACLALCLPKNGPKI